MNETPKRPKRINKLRKSSLVYSKDDSQLSECTRAPGLPPPHLDLKLTPLIEQSPQAPPFPFPSSHPYPSPVGEYWHFEEPLQQAVKQRKNSTLGPQRKRFYSDSRALIQDPSPEDDIYRKNYKTEICKNFQFRGFCKFGDICCFAHGEHELRFKPNTNELYKTKTCKQFSAKHFCPYGYRCQYRHGLSYSHDSVEGFFKKLDDRTGMRGLSRALLSQNQHSRRLKVFRKLSSENLQLTIQT